WTTPGGRGPRGIGCGGGRGVPAFKPTPVKLNPKFHPEEIPGRPRVPQNPAGGGRFGGVLPVPKGPHDYLPPEARPALQKAAPHLEQIDTHGTNKEWSAVLEPTGKALEVPNLPKDLKVTLGAVGYQARRLDSLGKLDALIEGKIDLGD